MMPVLIAHPNFLFRGSLVSIVLYVLSNRNMNFGIQIEHVFCREEEELVVFNRASATISIPDVCLMHFLIISCLNF